MTVADAFTPEQWALVAELPSRIVAAAATIETADGSGSTREVLAGLQGILQGAQLLRDNAIVDAVFDRYKTDGQGEALTLALSQSPPADLAASTLAQARAAAALLADRADLMADLPEFFLWLVGLADEIVAIATTGGFLGFGGRRVTGAETAFVGGLKAALGVVDVATS
ncbi:MAG: hypothetical protein ACR2OO_02145, partial [Thermomicrobiales bacterium]